MRSNHGGSEDDIYDLVCFTGLDFSFLVAAAVDNHTVLVDTYLLLEGYGQRVLYVFFENFAILALEVGHGHPAYIQHVLI